MLGAELVVSSGAAAPVTLGVLTVEGDIAVLGPGNDEAKALLQPGDAVEVDNRGYLAAQTYHRHQVPSADFAAWDQYRTADGSPVYPQRPLLLGPLFAAAAAGTVQTGRIEGKMIVVASLLDREALPWQADWYRARVEEHLGEATDERFRLWFTDNALHGDDEVQEHPTHSVSYLGVLHQALRDLSAWVEDDVAPPPSTSYEVVDGQVVVPDDAAARHGVQPVVTLTADGSPRADVSAGAEVTLRAVAEVPHGTGVIVTVAWDLDGAGHFPMVESVEPGERVVIERRHTFPEGTWFPTVRVTATRDGDTSDPVRPDPEPGPCPRRRRPRERASIDVVIWPAPAQPTFSPGRGSRRGGPSSGASRRGPSARGRRPCAGRRRLRRRLAPRG